MPTAARTRAAVVRRLTIRRYLTPAGVSASGMRGRLDSPVILRAMPTTDQAVTVNLELPEHVYETLSA